MVLQKQLSLMSPLPDDGLCSRGWGWQGCGWEGSGVPLDQPQWV